MGQFTFDDREIEQLWVAAHELGTRLARSRKDAINLRYATPALAEIDDQIARNMHLRMVLNPAAEKEAREAARRRRGERPRDPRQIDIEQEIKAVQEPNGKRSGKRAKKMSTSPVVDGLEVANPESTQEPDDEFILAQLQRAGVDIPLGIVNLWMSSERESALKWASDAVKDGELTTTTPMPPHVWKALWMGQYDFDPKANTEPSHKEFAAWQSYWLDVGPFLMVEEHGTGKRGAKTKRWVVEKEGKEVFAAKAQGPATDFAMNKNRQAAVSKLLGDMRERRIARLAGGDWVHPKPPKVDDVAADRVHNAAKEAR